MPNNETEKYEPIPRELLDREFEELLEYGRIPFRVVWPLETRFLNLAGKAVSTVSSLPIRSLEYRQIQHQWLKAMGIWLLKIARLGEKPTESQQQSLLAIIP